MLSNRAVSVIIRRYVFFGGIEMLVRDRKFYRDFLTMTMTIALQNLVVYGVNLADNIMLGAYSETAPQYIARDSQSVARHIRP